MKKVIMVSALVGFLAAVSLPAMAAPGGELPEKVHVGKGAVIRGENDKRVITPTMDARERVEIQRDIKRRAWAMRNALIRAEGNKKKPQQTGKPLVQPGIDS